MKYLLAFALALTACAQKPTTTSTASNTSFVSPLLPDGELRGFVQDMFTHCNAKLSPVKSELLRNQIARIVSERIEGLPAQQQFVFMLCRESTFDNARTSPVGAKGIAQLMPQYAPGFAKLCGFSGLEKDEINDVETNITLGACFFNSLVKQIKNVPLASAAYNAGAASSSVKNLKAGGSAVHETANYVASLAVMRAEMGKQ